MRTLLIMLTSAVIVGIPLFLMTCDSIPEGLETTVRGQVYDSVKHKMLEGVKVNVWACATLMITDMNADPCLQLIGTAKTNEQGRFKINFVTSGRASRYYASVEDDEHFYAPAFEEKVHAGADEFINLYARELNEIKIEVHVSDNPVGPIIVESATFNQALIHQATRDTIVYGRVLPLSWNAIRFKVFDETAKQTRVSIDEIKVGLKDTTIVKMIADLKSWDIQ